MMNKFELRKHGYVLTWTFLKSKTYIGTWNATVYSGTERYTQFYLSEEYGWVPMNMKNLGDVGYTMDTFAPPKIFSLKRHLRLALKHNVLLRACINRTIVVFKLKSKTTFPIIRKVSSKMWFTDPVKIKKVRKKMRW